jgi:CHAD domain-containing protein
VKARKIKGLEPKGPLRANAARIVATRLDELRGFADEALDPSGEAAQHEMRIAAKRLRYALEIVAPCLGPDAEAARALAKELQGVLGDIHDCDIMGPKAEGIETVDALLRTRRELLHARFRELWTGDGGQEVFARLGEFLSDLEAGPEAR